jgi:ketosteroid isomerase-like protein
VKVIRARALVIMVVALMLVGGALIWSGAANANSRREQSKRADLEQELKEIDQHWLQAATVKDIDYLKQLFADGMFEVQNGGSIVTGTEMQRYLAIPGRHVQIDIDQVEVRGIYGDTAILTDRTTQGGFTADGRKIAGLYIVMRVLKKLDGRWRAIGAHMTPMRPSTSTKANFDIPGAEQAKPAAGSVEQEIIDLDHKWVEATTKGDAEFLKALFAEGMFEVLPGGQIASGAERLKEIGARKPGQMEGYIDQIQVRGVYGDTAILTDRRVRKGTAADGRDISGQWRVTRVLVKQGGRWRAAAVAMTPIE